MRHLFLIGFMGSGKSTLAPLLSQKLKIPFVSTDLLIETQEAQSISWIFKHRGEEYFRNLEGQILQDIIRREQSHIVDCGGGLPIFNPISHLGVIVFLDLDFEVLLSRLSSDELHSRPLLEDKQKAYELYLQRRKIYLQDSDFVIDASMRLEEKVEAISKIWQGGKS